jgi:ABC-type nitrate/sulfonate/bicarbonate transport system permease component
MALVFWLAVWEALALIVHKEVLLPGPWKVLLSLLSLAGTGAFWKSVVLTLLRILAGFMAGVVFGTLIGVFTAWKRARTRCCRPLCGWCGQRRWRPLSSWLWYGSEPAISPCLCRR